jgi:DNA polymerase III delta prime subunit
MIGQENLQNRIQEQISNNTFPRFAILVGQKGSGKKTFARNIAKWLCENIIQLEDVKVDSIRNMVEEAYKIHTKTIYIIPDADVMSLAAKNAILKITEEPPNNAIFIMTLQDENNTLATIRSRGTIFRMDNYKPVEIHAFANYYLNHTLHDDEDEVIKNICETPGEVIKLCGDDRCNALDFYNYVELVVDNIAEVSGANAFKIGNKIAFKNEVDKYDLRLFLKAFMSVCSSRLHEDKIRYAHGIIITSEYLQQIRINGISKIGLFDCWILDIRKEWMGD